VCSVRCECDRSVRVVGCGDSSLSLGGLVIANAIGSLVVEERRGVREVELGGELYGE
jgi:hypothetical protein